MPNEFSTIMMSSGTQSVADFIGSYPHEDQQWLISATSECLSKKLRLNFCELESLAREIRYDRSAR